MKFNFIRKLLVTLLYGLYTLKAGAQTQTFSPVADAQVYQGNAVNNYGTGTLQVKKTPGSSNTRISYLKFNLSAYNLTQTGKAVLRVYLRVNDKTAVPTIVEALKVDDSSWQEGALTWNNKPLLLNTAATTIVSTPGNYYEWDVTDYVKSLNPVIGNNITLTIALRDVAESDALLTFNAKEYASNNPQLILSEELSNRNYSGEFYVDAVDGNDANNGTSVSTAWKTLDKLNSSVFSAGSIIRFKSGQTFPGTLILTGNGNSTNPVTYTNYGGAENAVIDGQGVKTSVYAYNKSYFNLSNLTLTNHRNSVITVADLFHALVIINDNAGTLNHIYLDHLDIKDVNSADDADAGGTKNHGGVFFTVLGSDVQSKWNDVLITNCNFENLSRTGINFESDWELRNSNTSFGDDLGDGRLDNWIPSTNIVFRYNTFKHIAGNGLVVRVAVNPLIEYNLFDYCGETISGNATFNFNTDGAVFQFNEAMHTVYNTGDTDARGIDSDFRTKNTYIQYNYLHDNGFGGVVATGGDQVNGSTPSIPERFNVNTVIRYNVVTNNDRQAVSFSGNMKSAEVYNNVFYADNNHNNVLIVRLAQWSVYPKNINFKNNIFSFQGAGCSYSLPSSSTYSFSKNLFFTPSISSEPADAGKIRADPLFISTVDGPNGFKLKPGSPALAIGNVIPDNGGRDYFNNPVSANLNPNIGPYEGAGTNSLPIKLINFSAKKLMNTVSTSWTTATESNNDYFEVERSLDGLNFAKVGTVKGAGDSKTTLKYSLIDGFPVNGVNYYRLKQVDKDGSYTYSEVIAVNFSLKDDADLMVFPNPATDFVCIKHESKIDENLGVKIYNLQGELAVSEKVNNSSEIKISLNTLKTGIYVLKMTDLKTGKKIGEAKFLKY